MKSSVTQNYCSEPSPSPFRRRPVPTFREGWGVRFTALALLALFTTCCKDDCLDPTNPNCENYDPCHGKTQPSAKFIMEESNPVLANQGIWYADSAFFGAMLRFRSEYDEDGYKHTWYVGAEVFNKATTPDRNFLNQSRPQDITVSHVLEYTPDLQCFPDDDGKDSVAQTFRLIASFNTDFQTYGTFRGVLDNEVDSFDIQILSIDADGQLANVNTWKKQWFINFHNRGDTITTDFSINYPLFIDASFYNHEGVFLDQIEGTFVVDENGFFEMNYRRDGSTIINDGLWHTFKGRKID
jgi:hypothetical protein